VLNVIFVKAYDIRPNLRAKDAKLWSWICCVCKKSETVVAAYSNAINMITAAVIMRASLRGISYCPEVAL